MREGSKQIGKKISRRKKQRKFSVMELIDGCIHESMWTMLKMKMAWRLEQRKIRIMIELLNKLHRIDRTFNACEI